MVSLQKGGELLYPATNDVFTVRSKKEKKNNQTDLEGTMSFKRKSSNVSPPTGCPFLIDVF